MKWIHGVALMGVAALAAAGELKATVADNRVDTCNQCSLQQVEAKATQRNVATMVGVYVLDYALERVWLCEVVREPELGGNVAACGLADAGKQAEFKEITSLIRQLNTIVEIPYPGGDIYSISGCPACARGWLLDNRHALANQLSLIDQLAAKGIRFGASLQVRAGTIDVSVEGQVRVKVKLSNDSSGGREKGYCIGALTNTELVIDTDQCTDSDGNPIPTLANLTIRRYVFTSTSNHLNMINRLRATGRTVHLGGIATVGELKEIDCNAKDCESKEPPPSNGGR